MIPGIESKGSKMIDNNIRRLYIVVLKYSHYGLKLFSARGNKYTIDVPYDDWQCYRFELYPINSKVRNDFWPFIDIPLKRRKRGKDDR